VNAGSPDHTAPIKKKKKKKKKKNQRPKKNKNKEREKMSNESMAANHW